MERKIFRLGTSGTELGLYDSLKEAVSAYEKLCEKYPEHIADVIEDDEEQPYIEEQIIEESDYITKIYGDGMYRLIERTARYDTTGKKI